MSEAIRLNRFIASASGLSRRAADKAIEGERVTVNGLLPNLGTKVADHDSVTLDGRLLYLPEAKTTIMFNKPEGYVTSRSGQGNKTIYMLLPGEYLQLKPVGRLDKDSSGLLLLTNDGDLAQKLTHPSNVKDKRYEVELDKPLVHEDKIAIQKGVKILDGISKLNLSGQGTKWVVTMHEGRNRQIRRTFIARGYRIKKLHRTHFGEYELGNLTSGSLKKL